MHIVKKYQAVDKEIPSENADDDGNLMIEKQCAIEEALTIWNREFDFFYQGFSQKRRVHLNYMATPKQPLN